MNKIDIPKQSVLGLHYSGMHDSSVSIISPDGEVIFASSLERYSRVKSDGRFPEQILDLIPLENITTVALTNAKKYIIPNDSSSNVHPVPLKNSVIEDRSHGNKWIKQIDKYFYNKKKVFVNHHLAHASSSFYLSGLNDAICLVYDGGMSNEHWFGGVYFAYKKEGIKEIDLFSPQEYSNVTYLYLSITALLGFTPLKHEGKITGLAALGNTNIECKNILNSWLENPNEIGMFKWKDMYDDIKIPHIETNIIKLENLQVKLSKFSKEDIAATVQNIAEEHIYKIIQNIKKLNLKSKNICLSGGLFANVKINQKISELGFDNIFIAPPMSDDGTSLGAAYLCLPSEKRPIDTVETMYLGNDGKIDTLLSKIKKLNYIKEKNADRFIAQKLAEGKIFAIFQGKAEFGPRALGNRTILAPATQSSINDGLNNKLSRTEFMPFAPVIRDIDADKYFILKDGEKNTSRFMTITCKCTKLANEDCPAVIHIDNTARPQIVSKESNELIYNVLTNYVNISAKLALVNTSFNIHEEPIINSYEDAIRGFFESGLDYLYIDGIIVPLENNLKIHSQYLVKKIKKKEEDLKKNLFLKNRLYFLNKENNQKSQKFEIKANELQNELEQSNQKSQKFEIKANELQNELEQSNQKSQKFEIKANELQNELEQSNQKSQKFEIKAKFIKSMLKKI